MPKSCDDIANELRFTRREMKIVEDQMRLEAGRGQEIAEIRQAIYDSAAGIDNVDDLQRYIQVLAKEEKLEKPKKELFEKLSNEISELRQEKERLTSEMESPSISKNDRLRKKRELKSVNTRIKNRRDRMKMDIGPEHTEKSANIIRNNRKLLQKYLTLLRRYHKSVRDRVGRAAVEGDVKGARFAVVKNHIAEGILDVRNFFRQSIDALGEKGNIYTKVEEFRTIIFKDLGFPELQRLTDDEQNDLNNPVVKDRIQRLTARIHSLADSLLLDPDESFNISPEENHVYFRFSRESVLKHIFAGKAGTWAPQKKAFIAEFMNAVDLDWFNRIIGEVYGNADLPIPTPEDAMFEFLEHTEKGVTPRLIFRSLKFKNSDAMVNYMKKWGNLTVLRSFYAACSDTAADLAAVAVHGKVIGRQLLDDLINIQHKVKPLTDKEIKRIKAHHINYGGYRFHHPVQVLKALENIGKFQKVVMAGHYVSMFLAPSTDFITGVFSRAARAKEGFLPLQVVRAIGDSLRRTAELGTFKGYREDIKELKETAPSLSHPTMRAIADGYNRDFSRFGPEGATNLLMNHYEITDSALLVDSCVRLAREFKYYDSLDDMKERASGLYRVFTENFHISDEDFNTIKTTTQDSEFLDSTLYNGELATKVAALSYSYKYDTAPMLYKPDELVGWSKFNRDHPYLSRMFGMFWGFTIRTAVGLSRVALESSEGSKLSAYARGLLLLTAASIIPSYIAGTLFGFATDPEDEEKRLSSAGQIFGSLTEAAAGPVGRIATIPADFFYNSTELANAVSSPLIQAVRTAVISSYDVYEGDERRAMRRILKMLLKYIPYIGDTALVQYPFQQEFPPLPRD